MNLEERNKKIRTARANNAMHLWFTEVARELNDRGIDMRVLVKDLQVAHTKESVKVIWKAIAEAKYGKDSTTKLTSKEIDEIYDEMNRLLALHDIHISFPSNLYFLNEESYNR